MAIFSYTGRNRAGEKTQGSVEADDRRAAIMEIEKRGITPTSVAESAVVAAQKKATRKSLLVWRRSGARMGTRQVLLFTTELADLLASGMTLGNALNCLANRETGKATDAIVVELRDEIIRGASLSEALSRHPRSFSRLYVSMIRAGEASGAQHEVLRRLVDHYERVQDTKEKVTAALIYPLIVIAMGGVTMLFAMVYIVPKFEEVFSQMKQSLPLSTRMLIGTSRALAAYGWLFAIAVIVGVELARRGLRTERGRFWKDGAILRVPMVKQIVASGIYANMARTLGTLLKNGVPVLQALGILEQTVGNAVLAREIHGARERVTDGTTISGPLAASGVFPRIMTDMLTVGEQTGDMPGALAHIARRYDSELNRNLKIFTTALEPILIVGVALMVGFIAMSILQAVLSFTNGLGA